MKAKMTLIVLIAIITLTGHAMAQVTVGTYNVTGTWSEFLTGGQGGQAGNSLFASDTDWFLTADLFPPPNPAALPWAWDTTYNNADLLLSPTGPWDGGGATATGFELQFLSTGYDPTSGTLAWAMTGSGVLDTSNPFTMAATYGTLANPGTPYVLPVGNDAIMGGDLSTASITIRPIEPTEPGVYGLFVGVNHTTWSEEYNKWVTLRGDLSAENLYHAVSRNLANFREGIVITADMGAGGLRDNQVQEAIDQLNSRMSPGDKLLFYANAHGNSDLLGPETTATFGDEYIEIGEDNFWPDDDYLTDDELTSYLDDMLDMEKWVMMDSCHSGGFWGNNYWLDDGDLEKISNISLFAASAEDTNAYFDSITGLPYFGSALVDAFSFDSTGYLVGDINQNSVITFNELTDWVQNYSNWSHMDGTLVYEMGFGDPILFASNMWTPVSFASDDFTGSYGFEAVPAPSALFLSGLGLAFASWRLRRCREV